MLRLLEDCSLYAVFIADQNYSDWEVGFSWKFQWLETMTGGLRDVYGLGNYFLLSRSGWAGTAKM